MDHILFLDADCVADTNYIISRLNQGSMAIGGIPKWFGVYYIS